MLTNDDFPTTEEIERTVIRALRRYGYAPAEPLSSREDDHRRNSFVSAGTKLRGLRELSGWTVSEIAERTGVRLDILTAFEDGDTAAADELTRFDLERLASACCGSLADLLGPEHPWMSSEPDFSFLGDSGCAIDPCG